MLFFIGQPHFADTIELGTVSLGGFFESALAGLVVPYTGLTITFGFCSSSSNCDNIFYSPYSSALNVFAPAIAGIQIQPSPGSPGGTVLDHEVLASPFPRLFILGPQDANFDAIAAKLSAGSLGSLPAFTGYRLTGPGGQLFGGAGFSEIFWSLSHLVSMLISC